MYYKRYIFTQNLKFMIMKTLSLKEIKKSGLFVITNMIDFAGNIRYIAYCKHDDTIYNDYSLAGLKKFCSEKINNK